MSTQNSAPQYDIQRLQPKHAPGVTDCFIDVYGHTYPTEFAYQPDKLAELNESGELISIVAIVQKTGEVVGHCSVQRCYPGGSAEAGLAVVRPSHRGSSLLERMSACLDAEALREGVHCLVTHEVTSHLASQVAAHRAGYRNCCLALGAMPSTLDFKKTVDRLVQRESCVVSMKFLAVPDPVVLCVPGHHREMVGQIYEYLGKAVSFEPLPESKEAGTISTRFNAAWGSGDIQVRQIGADTEVEVVKYIREMRETHDNPTLFLELPLDQGGVENVCLAAEAEGFFFAGLGPNTTHGGESLFLQYVAPELDMALLQIYSSMGQEIASYVSEERMRVGTNQ